jgi:TonB-linked SusC/RagA family outer membrane protein
MRMKSLCLYLLLLVGLLSLHPNLSIAQNGKLEVKGKVTSNDLPLEGVSVTVKGGKEAGTVTDKNGQFKIVLQDGKSSLTFSYVGYTDQTIAVNNKSTINVSLVSTASETEEVVVIGYQTVKRKNVLASIASVSAKDLKDIPVNSAAEALNGRLAGVTATTAEGAPDADVTVRVRGGMSITGDNSPLYIVDGIQVENGLSAIAPQNIQNIDVLKDAAATAIYGARGANGVIVITTKRGKPGKLQVSYNGFVGVKLLAKKLGVLSPSDYVMYQSERSRGSNTDSLNFIRNFGTTWDTLKNYNDVGVVDWQDELMGRTGIAQTHNITAAGGVKNLTYNFGYTRNDDKAVILNSTYKRDLLNFSADYKFSKKLKAALTTRYTQTEVNGAGVSSNQGSSFSRLRNAVKYRPFLSSNQDLEDPDPLADPNVGNGLNLINPITLADAEYRRKSTAVGNIALSVTYNIAKNLTFKSTVGYDHFKLVDRQFSDSITPYSMISGSRKPIAQLDTAIRRTITNSNVLTYSINKFKGKHDFDFLLGQETFDFRTESYTQLVRGFANFIAPDDAFGSLANGISFTGFPRVNKTRYTNMSFFSRINYAYENKYYVTLNARADGASKFAPGRQWGLFPSGSVAWRAKNEKFLKDNNFISDLKFRAGYGNVGNNRINDYLFLTTFSNDGRFYYGINNQPINAYYSAGLVNEALQWESNESKNFGMDLSILNDRITLSLDVYNNQAKNLLLNVPIASTYGYSSQLQNIGKTSNRGVELQLGALIAKKKDFTWNANFNISFNTNRVEALGQNQNLFFPAASWGVSGQPTDYIVRIGDPVGAMWGLINDGFYTVNDFNYNPATSVYSLKPGIVNASGVIGTVQPGSIKYKDLDGDGVISMDKDRTIIGNPTPKFTGGLAQQFTYKNWDMSLFLNFSYGNDIYNANKIEFTNGYTPNSNMLDIMANRWKVVTPQGQTAQWISSTGQVMGIAPNELQALNANATIWQPIRSAGAFFPSSWAIEDGSFLRVNNLTVGYSLPVKNLVKMKISKLRFYFTANNLAVFTKYTGYDPEVSVRNSPLTPGLDYSAYPKSRSFIFGVNANF